jgi:Na+:H+ antiporter, NhaA family
VNLTDDGDRSARANALPAPPGSWGKARRLVRKVLAPVERFLAIEAASGVLLLLVAVVALAWANSPWRTSYDRLWHAPFGFHIGPWSFEKDFHFWINDGLMTIFFFVVGLEIRREIHGGELSGLRRAALPLVAALGGMLVPAAVFLAFNRGHGSARGWGIPMATDIAFAVGVLALLGKRVPPALRILLLALAVIDDVGAILVIALFYSSGFAAFGFLVLGLGLVGTLAMQMLGVRNPWAYVPPAVVIWAGMYAIGIHPTLAGVVVGLMTPARAWLGSERFLRHADKSVAALREQDVDDDRAMLPYLDDLSRAGNEAVSPVERIEHALHGWVAFVIMPLFALANAGVSIEKGSFSGDSILVFGGITIGLIVGKPLGILGFSWASVWLGLAALPGGVTWRQVSVVGLVGGIGFTMALFIAQLAFSSASLLETAKLGILVASGVAALIAFVVGRFLLPATPASIAAPTASHAESSTDF